MDQPVRFPWDDFPDVLIHAPELFVKRHRVYAAAKGGDAGAATELVVESTSPEVLESLWLSFNDKYPVLVSVHAEEAAGINAIAEGLARFLAITLHWQYDDNVVQANKVSHTGANGFDRLRRQAIFSGVAGTGLNYLMVDDFIGQGGTLANLRGHLIAQGGNVIGATVLTGKDYSAKLVPTADELLELRRKHGNIEDWWRQRFGFGFECPPASEARYLRRTPASETILTRLAEAAS
ncbi:hypothetical protein JOD97_005251 [Duganella sp. 1411]|jgi:hypothetical protein|uniref:phosphoribosyltransferase n=1 Tax=Duganella sp. 1411 TaxID=2806572 RepID=UPI001AE58A4A|nr:phosphoribosyltransferase [Duganella sp. 1411]MBP1207172.1 hypothetical protein [Duganella sp. 1411]